MICVLWHLSQPQAHVALKLPLSELVIRAWVTVHGKAPAALTATGRTRLAVAAAAAFDQEVLRGAAWCDASGEGLQTTSARAGWFRG